MSLSEESALIRRHPLPNCYSEQLLVLRRGEGVWLEDRAGRRYLDFAGGIAVNALGYGRADLAEIACQQMKTLAHVSNLYVSEPALELGHKMLASGALLGREPFGAVQFQSSGSEANETALKYARLYALRRRGPGCHKLLAFTGAFHGRTLGALSVTPTPKYQEPFQPLLPGVTVAEYNDVAALEGNLDGGCAGVIVEVVQGEGGLAVMSREFAAALNRLCRDHDVVLIADEVQTGLSRTGSFFASTAVGLEPDIVTLAKPLAGGLPLSAVLIPEKINALIHLGEHGTTFGGGPVTTAVASRVWDLLSQPELIDSVREKGEYLKGRLEGLVGSFPFLDSTRGRGLLQGLAVRTEALPAEDPMGALLEACRREGLLILRSGPNVLRIAPPLVIGREELDTGIAILKRVFDGLQAGSPPQACG